MKRGYPWYVIKINPFSSIMNVDDATMKRLFAGIVTLQDTEGNVLTFSGNSFLMSIVLTMGTDAVNLSSQGCVSTERMNMLYGDDRVAGIYKVSQLPPDLMEEYNRKRGIFYAGLKPDAGIAVLKETFKNCVGSVDFFYIPLTLVYSPNVFSPRHANGILVSKSKGTYFRIEPQYSPEGMDTTQIDQGIKNILGDIGARDFRQIGLNVVCPQFLTNDMDCQFWTAYLTLEIIRNMYKNPDPNTTITQIMTANNTPEKLRATIETFKKQVSQAVLKGLAKSNMTWVEYERVKTPRTGGMYWPLKYYRGLTRKQNMQRKRSATRRTKMSFKNPKAYVPFKSDKGVKTRKSSYTERFHKKYPEAKSLSEIAKATGISKSILQEVYDRGMAAWRTGHRPGASQHAWGMARVHSFVMKGKTWRTADADLARKV